ncbi:hypothetical protein J7L68_01270 [bacterium]|nr:hypothetical protein [bacterium]
MKIKTRNIILIVISVSIAVILWLNVITERQYETDLYVSLAIENIPPKYVIANKIPTIVHIQVSGKGKDLLAQFLTGGSAKISVANFSYGRKTIELESQNFDFVSSEIKLDEVLSPKEVVINLDRKRTKKVPVKSQLVIIPADGMYCSKEPDFRPSVITVEGPESKLNKISYIYTASETLREFNTSTSFLVPLLYPDEKVIPVPDTVAVLVEVDKLIQRRIENVGVNITDMSNPIGIVEPSAITVIITGPKDDVENLKASQIKAYITFNDTIENKVKPTIIVPENVQVIGTDPEFVKINQIDGAK